MRSTHLAKPLRPAAASCARAWRERSARSTPRSHNTHDAVSLLAFVGKAVKEPGRRLFARLDDSGKVIGDAQRRRRGGRRRSGRHSGLCAVDLGFFSPSPRFKHTADGQRKSACGELGRCARLARSLRRARRCVARRRAAVLRERACAGCAAWRACSRLLVAGLRDPPPADRPLSRSLCLRVCSLVFLARSARSISLVILSLACVLRVLRALRERARAPAGDERAARRSARRRWRALSRRG